MLKSTAYLDTPIGWLEITGTGAGIESVAFVHMLSDIRSCCPGLNSFVNLSSSAKKLESSGMPDCIKKCIIQLDEYFAGKRKEFDVPVNPKGTDFQKLVWDKVSSVRFGKTSSYSEIAVEIGDEKAVRAVGNANSRNPVPIIIPCHRIIGANGKLTGYAGGLWRKQWLLDFESNSNSLF